MTQARENRVRKIKIEAPRGDIVDRNGNRLVAHARRRRSSRSCPSGAAGRRARGRRRLPQALAARPSARASPPPTSCASLERRRREDGAPLHASAETPRAPPAAPRLAPAPRPVARAADARGRAEAAPLFRRLGRVIGLSPADDPPARHRGHRRGAVLQRDGQDRRPARRASTTSRSASDEFPGVDVEKLYLRDYPHKELGAQLFGTLREISPAELKQKQLPRRRGRHADRQGRHRGDLRPLPARPGRLHAGGHQRARQPRRHARRSRAASPSRASSCA